MKKYIQFILCIIVTSLFSVGCRSSLNSNDITISKETLEEHATVGMGIDYKIEGLANENYDVMLYAKEYNKGIFKQEHDLFNEMLDLSSNKSFTFNIYQEENSIKTSLDKSYFYTTELDFFKYGENGTAMSIVDDTESIKLDKEIPVAVYSMSKLGKTTQSVIINEGKYEIESDRNETDLVIFIKITKVQ